MNLELILKTAKRHFREGSQSMNKGHLEIALYLYKKALEIDPEKLHKYKLHTYSHRGMTNFYLGNIKEAIKDYDMVLEIDPDQIDGYVYRGFFQLEFGRWKNAIEDFNKVLEIDPENTVALVSRGDSKYFVNLNESAKSDYRKALSLFKREDNPTVDDYKWAIRAERGLIKLGVRKKGTIEQKAIQEGIITKEQLKRF